MKVKVLSLLVPALLVAGAANAAEVYNKDGNKLDLYGKVDGLHYFSDNKSEDGDQTYVRLCCLQRYCPGSDIPTGRNR
ncbi:porin, partial [Escherichia coli]